MVAPDVETTDGNIIISSEEGETDENLPKFLKVTITHYITLNPVLLILTNKKNCGFHFISL